MKNLIQGKEVVEKNRYMFKIQNMLQKHMNKDED